eukprot:TRINITY_DN55181_c0_g1_i1.p1 TRINITY_DN55181_c0_g1~~TRINITY_DN55181_c0_g1_i1.p1  ORF type:complete len:451 (+),score=169.57 TRINITY_DN55181_c0_g1_i1:86-1438(+)
MAEPEIVEGEEQEQEKEVAKINYEAVDERTGFKKVDYALWQALQDWKKKPEDDDGPSPDTLKDPESAPGAKEDWLKGWAEDDKNPLKPPEGDAKAQAGLINRATYVAKLGIYAGQRNKFEQRDGRGKAIYASIGLEDDVYEGQFFEGKKNGQGMYISKSLGKSEVDVLIEKMVMEKPQEWRCEGQGGHTRIVPAHHDEFVAEVMARLAVGEQVVETALEYGYYPCYHGEYQNGVRNGDGLMKGRDGSVYKGEWKNGKRHGQGIYYYRNGDVYSGNWREGSKHGYGTYRFAHWEKELKRQADGTLRPQYSVHYGGDYRGEWGGQMYKRPNPDDPSEKVQGIARGCFLEGEWRMPDGFHYEGAFIARPEETEKPDVGRRNLPHTNKPKPPPAPPGPAAEAEEAELAAGPPPPGQMHFRRWNLMQQGVMKFGRWAPQNELFLVDPAEADAAGY